MTDHYMLMVCCLRSSDKYFIHILYENKLNNIRKPYAIVGGIGLLCEWPSLPH